jgi:hypothetical protein
MTDVAARPAAIQPALLLLGIDDLDMQGARGKLAQSVSYLRSVGEKAA